MSLKHTQMLRAINVILRLSEGKRPKYPGLAGYNTHHGSVCAWGGGSEQVYGFKRVSPDIGAIINKTMDELRARRL